MFGISLLPNVRMQELYREMTILSQLYALYSDADAMLARHRACPWLEVSVDTISNDIDRVVDLCHNQPPESQSTGCFRHLMSKLDDVRQLLPLVALLRHDTVRRRHWLGLQEVIGARLPVPFDRASEPNPFPLEALLSVCRSQSQYHVTLYHSFATTGTSCAVSCCNRVSVCQCTERSRG